MRMKFGKVNLKRAFKLASQFASEHLPEIMVGAGITSMLVGTGLAVKATVDAVHDVERIEEETGEELTKTEIVKNEWPKFVLPSALVFGGASFVTCGFVKQLNKTGMAMTMLAGAMSELQDHQDKVAEMLGADKEKEIHDAVVTERAMKDLDNDISEAPSPGYERCYDKLTGRVFYASRELVKQAINEMNWRMTRGGEPYQSYNEYCESINEVTFNNNLPPVNPIGESLGWNPDWGMIEPNFAPVLDSKGRPCLCVYFDRGPKINYQSFR